MRRYNINEFQKQTAYRKLNASYQVMDDAEEHVVGICKIEDGVITKLDYTESKDNYFAGQVVTTILTAACKEADSKDCFLYIEISDTEQNFKKMLERFGFRDQGENILKRGPGSILPPNPALVPGFSGGL